MSQTPHGHQESNSATLAPGERMLTAVQFQQSAQPDDAAELEWLANIAITRLYDKRGSRIEESPTFRVRY